MSVAARAAGVIGGGLQPTASGGAELALALRTRFVRIELAGRTWFPDRAQIAAVPGAETLAQLALAEARVCPYGWVRRVELGGCAGWAAGGVIVATRGVRRPDRAAAFASTLSLGPMLAWHMHRRLALWVEPALVVALYRPRFVVDGIGEVWRMGPAAGQVALGLEVALGPTIIE